MKIYGITVIVGAFLLLDVTAQECDCGYMNRCCASDETCEENVRGGTCYKTADRVMCDLSFYCYKPTTCCRIHCCAEGTKCCGSTACCPYGSNCCGSLCCDHDSTCKAGKCVAKSPFPWYIILCIIVLIVALIASVLGLARYSKRRAEGRAQGPVEFGDQDMMRTSAPHPMTPSPQVIATVDQHTMTQSARYEDVSDDADDFGFKRADNKGCRTHEPNSYNLVGRSNASFNGNYGEPPQPASNASEMDKNVNSSFEADRFYMRAY